MANLTLCSLIPTAGSLLHASSSSSSSSSSIINCCCPRGGYGVSLLSAAWPPIRWRRRPLPLPRVVAETAEAVAPATGLIMNLKVEGTLAESLIPKVTDALKKVDGVANLKVYTSEGVATVELEKETTIQATGEASSLVEKIQAEGFKLQNLCISFDDEAAGDDDDIAYEYESTS